MITFYFILILIIGLLSYKRSNLDDYLYCSRRITLPSFVATLVTTWYGGILEIGRFTYENGIVTWIIFGLFYYIAAILYVYLLVPKLRFNNVSSIPDYFGKHYGEKSKLISAFIIVFISSPAPYILILSTIISHIYNISFHYSVFLSTITSIVYIHFGGYRSIIRTDRLQFVFMFTGFVVMLYYLINTYGGIQFLLDNVPKKNLSITGNLPIGYILSWLLIAFITLIDPSIFQRTYSANSTRVVKKGILISVIFWIIFDFLTITTGLYASAIIDVSSINPYLYLSDNILPPFARNIFYISIISIVMSTIDSFSFVSAFTIGKDIFKKKSLKNVQIGLFITAILSIIIIYNFKKVIDMWYIFGSIAASSLLIPFLLILFAPHKKSTNPEACLLIPIIINITWIFLGYPLNLDSMYPGIVVSGFINYLSSKSVSSKLLNVS